MFVDRVSLTLQAGDGGDGIVSFHHEKSLSMGGPDGGDGGDGGDIIFRSSRNQDTLAAFRYKKFVNADSGKPGSKTKCHGKNGKDLIIDVPVGTAVMDKDGKLLADLVNDDQEAKLAQGGRGGFGNAHFISSTRQAPRIAEKGEKGRIIETVMELKMIADVGIVGLPNAGKSTLLSVISNAKPEIANYPFTTLHPNLGVVDVDGKTSLLVADIPGLIEGAADGKGLGDEFLRHVERTSVLVHLIDAYNEDIKEAYTTIMHELAAYRVDLSTKPQVVALTKTEGMDKEQIADLVSQVSPLVPKGTKVTSISSASGAGVKELLRTLQKIVIADRQKHAKTEESKVPIITIEEDEDTWKITKTEEGYVITGRKVERFASRTHFDDYHGLQRLRDILGKMGILRELHRQGIEADQKIIIGNPSIGTLDY